MAIDLEIEEMINRCFPVPDKQTYTTKEIEETYQALLNIHKTDKRIKDYFYKEFMFKCASCGHYEYNHSAQHIKGKYYCNECGCDIGYNNWIMEGEEVKK